MCPIDGRECVVGPSTPGSSGCPIHSSHHHGCTIPVCLKNSGGRKSYAGLPSSFGTMSVCPCILAYQVQAVNTHYGYMVRIVGDG